MPNWCENEVHIKGHADVLREIENKSNLHIDREDSGLFNAFIPMPSYLRGTTSPGLNPEGFTKALAGDTEYVYDNWYDWSLAHWGTKWDVSDVWWNFIDGVDGDPTLVVSFNTAWSPSIPVSIALSKLYPVEVSHYYSEEGMGFAGKFVVADGVELEDNYINSVSTEQYKSIGAVMDKDGCVDWDVDQNYNIYDLFK